MKRVCFYLIIVFVLTSLTSCSRPYLIKEEPKFRPNEGKALVNFVRPSYSGYVGATTKIWDSDKLIIISDRGEEWYIDQYNRNRLPEDQIISGTE